MINFWIALRNPFPCKEFKNLWNVEGNLSTNKAWEIQLSQYAFNFFEIKIDLNWRQTDHAGPWIALNLFGLTLDLRIYDKRHWDDSTNSWGVTFGKPN